MLNYCVDADQYFRSSQDEATLEMLISGESDGYRGIGVQHPDDDTYMSGYLRGTNAAMEDLFSHLEQTANEFDTSLASCGARVAAIGEKVEAMIAILKPKLVIEEQPF